MLPFTSSPGELEPAARTLVRLLPTLRRLIAAETHAAPQTAGMTLLQFRILCRLSERDYRAGELAQVLEVGRPTLTAAADGLERRELIERLRDVPGDRRGVLLRLTPAGDALHRSLETRAAAGISAALTETSRHERDALELGLRALERSLQDAGRGEGLSVAEAR